MHVNVELDIMTLTVIVCLTSICQAIALFIQYKISRNYPCIRWWWFGSIAQTIGFVCILFMKNPSIYFLAVFANPLILLGHLFNNKGISKFFDIKAPFWYYIAYFVGFLTVYYYFIFVNDSITGRGVVVSVFLAIVLYASSLRLFKNRKGVVSTSVRFTAVIYMIHGCFSTIYAINVLFYSNIQSYVAFNQSLILVGAFIIPIITDMLIVYGFILMVNQHLNGENDMLVQQLEVEKKIAEENSIVDSMTGLMNRRYLDNVLETEFNRLKRIDAPLSLIMLDIDYFKKFNDYYGHVAGDECLKKIGKALKSTVIRSGDTVARYGGEEFFVILPETNEEGAVVFAKKLRLAIENLAITHEQQL